MPHLIVLIGLAFIYGYLNGQYGSASVVAAMISSRSIHPRLALGLTAAGMGLGPFVLGSAVASTVADGLVQSGTINLNVVLAALSGAIIWSLFTLWLKIPVSMSQGLFGGLIGATWIGFGHEVIIAQGLLKLVAGLFLSPLLGSVCGFAVLHLCYWLTTNATPHMNIWFQRGQVVVSFIMAMAFGSNDAQKLMGVIVLGLVAMGSLNSSHLPEWVVAFSAAAICIGTLVGGWRLIHTMGGKFYKIRPIHGFGAQAASAGVIMGAGLAGWPVSGSQVVTSAIIGAGSADRLQKVRWGVVRQIAIGWLLTMPMTGFVSAVLYQLIKGLTR
ncbi:MAG: inorganic phosphate transporter [Anaerolineae bacterium]|nr:inorganic phosphate transporter [Anaerolineae bacterium]